MLVIQASLTAIKLRGKQLAWLSLKYAPIRKLGSARSKAATKKGARQDILIGKNLSLGTQSCTATTEVSMIL